MRVTAVARAAIEAEGRAALEYVEARDPDTLRPLAGPSNRMTILVAAHIGPARLIDTITLQGGEAA
jgi:pantothenate synthetase